MPIGKYTLDEVFVGDEVIFNSDQVSTDYYWIVTGKDEKLNKIFIKTAPEAIKEDWWTLDVSEIRVLTQSSRLRTENSR